jgi:uncharacterized membrane protein
MASRSTRCGILAVVKVSSQPRLLALSSRIGLLVRAIQEDDEAMLDAVLQMSRSRRAFAPLALTIGALAMLLDGLKLLVSNWRLTLVQILPAMWIWLAMYDLRAHVLRGKSFPVLRGPVLIPIILVIVAVTAASFFLNAVFAFAIAQSRPPMIRPATIAARQRLAAILTSGAIVGLLLGLAVTVATRWGSPWFALSLGIVVGVMMLCYVAVPARLIGMKTTYSTRDKVTATALGGVLGATVCTPPYLLGRLGILMLGSRALLIPGLFVLTLGVTLQAGATGAVRAIKLSAKLTAGHDSGQEPPDGLGELPDARAEGTVAAGQVFVDAQDPGQDRPSDGRGHPPGRLAG